MLNYFITYKNNKKTPIEKHIGAFYNQKFMCEEFSDIDNIHIR